jgi:predicted flavoprotein YhiN
MGEVIDCDGLCGGFNLSFAFLSALEVSEVLYEVSNK